MIDNGQTTANWASLPYHRRWLIDRRTACSIFFQCRAMNPKGGFFYALDWADIPAKTNKLWWPMCEAASAAHFLNEHLPSEGSTKTATV